MANIVLLLVIIMLVFSVIGVTLFRDIVPMYFGNLSSCILFCFQILTCFAKTLEARRSNRTKSERPQHQEVPGHELAPVF